VKWLIKLTHRSLQIVAFCFVLWWEHIRCTLSKNLKYIVTVLGIRSPELTHLLTKFCTLWPTLSISSSSLPPPAPSTTVLHSGSISYLLYMPHVSEIMQCCLAVCLISLSIMSSGFIHVVASCVFLSFLWLIVHVYSTFSLSVYPSVDTKVVYMSWLLLIMLQ